MSYPRRKGMNILLKQGSSEQGNKKCFYASTPSEPAQTCPHIHSSNGGFQLVYDSSTMAVVGMIWDLAHTDSLWLANNLQEQVGQTNEEKLTSKQQNESQSQTVLVPGAVWHPRVSRSMREPSRSSRGEEGVYVGQAIRRAGSPYRSPLSLCTGKSLCPTAPARAPLYSPSWAPEERAFQKHSFYRSLGGSAHILLCCRPWVSSTTGCRPCIARTWTPVRQWSL